MTDPDLDRLFTAAAGVRENAYAPYSGFRVGAALLTPSGHLAIGCNVENAAYPSGTCAEEAAIAAMVAAGESRIAAMVILGEGAALVTPCGACRQRLREFGAPDLAIHVGDGAGRRARFTLEALLPQAFGPDNLRP